jgi:uncharacterized protein YdhG (YjbR/CyaY superfamily)
MMKPEQAAPQTIDEYIAGYPPDVQKILKKIRTTIRKAAPKAAETIKYQMPTYTLNGNLVSFGVYKQHIGIYPVPAGTKKFQREIAGYRSAKSTVRLPLDEPIPLDLIGQLVQFRVKENQGGFLYVLGAPARRALEREGITTVKQLARYNEKDILALHGMGPSSMPKLRAALKADGLAFSKQ